MSIDDAIRLVRPFQQIGRFELLFSRHNTANEALKLKLELEKQDESEGRDPREDLAVGECEEIARRVCSEIDEWLVVWRSARHAIETSAPLLIRYFPEPDAENHTPEQLADLATECLGRLLLETKAGAANSLSPETSLLTKVTPINGPAQAPAVILRSWDEICQALDTKKTRAKISQLRKANRDFNGPIVLPSRGGQPIVEKAHLVSFVNSLAEKARARRLQIEDSQATCAIQHSHGRAAVVAPEIGGHIQKRRSSPNKSSQKMT